MRKHSVSPSLLGGFVAACISLGATSFGAVTVMAQTPPTATAPTGTTAPVPGEGAKPSVPQATTAEPAATPAPPAAASSKSSKAVGKPVPSTRKYDRSYKHCKMRALRRGLKGTERRAFIRRCELGFAPPRALVVPAPVPAGTSPAMPTATPVPGAAPARK